MVITKSRCRCTATQSLIGIFFFSRWMGKRKNFLLFLQAFIFLQLRWIAVKSYAPGPKSETMRLESYVEKPRANAMVLFPPLDLDSRKSIERYNEEDSKVGVIPSLLSSVLSTMEMPSPATEISSTRRRFFEASFTALLSTAAITHPTAARASVAEIDKATGSLYTPKKEMLAGGSAAARGIKIQSINTNTRPSPGQPIQTVYETRFIAYLSRFLLNFDDAASAWWKQNTEDGAGKVDMLQFKFAEFAESVEIGLADYFVGPYGSYSSLSAMKAGISAKQQAKSRRYYDDDQGIGQKLCFNLFRSSNPLDTEMENRRLADRDRIAKQGVLNLYTLLKARYTSRTAKRQLAILFSFFSNQNVQPTAEITSLLGEIDNATVTKVDWIKPTSKNEAMSRTSSRRGGGYSILEPPTVTIEAPPALGSAYKCATTVALLQPTSRVLKIKILDGGLGYTSPPDVYISGSGVLRSSSACAVIDREGRVEEIVVLDPGYGYGRRKSVPPNVVIAPPDRRAGLPNHASYRFRQAIAKAELEYEIVGIGVLQQGNGYVATDPPKVTVTPPSEDPDWFVDTPELDLMESEYGPVRAEVAEMRGPKGNIAYILGGTMADRTTITPNDPIKLSLQKVRYNPTELLPSAIRPELNSYGSYVIPAIAAVRTYDNIMDNQRFRAVDPLFGAIGTLPAQKSANELKPSEYARLALSGALCTVLVRTALNPLELIKTKLQLENDDELLSFARKSKTEGLSTDRSARMQLSMEVCKEMEDLGKVDCSQVAIAGAIKTTKNSADVVVVEESVNINSKDLIVKLIELRGPAAIFQSADITFLASLVFGSLGFGATELFRRSFTMAFFMGENSGQSNTEIVLLLAATVATILTSAAAAPFELLRVRSMGMVEAKPWTEVAKEFLREKLGKEENAEIEWKQLSPQDVKPLWQGFGPTASRELAFAIPKFLAFDLIAKGIVGFANAQLGTGALPIQVGVGSSGLAVSAFSGAIAGIVGAIVSHPADLILTRLSVCQKSSNTGDEGTRDAVESTLSKDDVDWKDIVRELLSNEGGIANLFVGIAPRIVFFFLVIGLQFFLYDYVKNLLDVGSDDLSLVLDVFYAVRQGLVDNPTN